MRIVPVSACDISKRFVLETSIRGRLIKSATSSAKIVLFFYHSVF